MILLTSNGNSFSDYLKNFLSPALYEDLIHLEAGNLCTSKCSKVKRCVLAKLCIKLTLAVANIVSSRTNISLNVGLPLGSSIQHSSIKSYLQNEWMECMGLRDGKGWGRLDSGGGGGIFGMSNIRAFASSYPGTRHLIWAPSTPYSVSDGGGKFVILQSYQVGQNYGSLKFHKLESW